MVEDFAARCCSCSARRSSLLNFGRGGGITRFGGGAFFFLVTAASVASADGGGRMVSCELDMIKNEIDISTVLLNSCFQWLLSLVSCQTIVP